MSIRPSSLARQRMAGLRERNHRVEQHRELVHPVALHYARHCRESVEDLHQVGLLGLIRAAELYRSEQGTPFPAFARPHIRGAILHYLRDLAPMVRLPRRQAELQDQLGRLERLGGTGAMSGNPVVKPCTDKSGKSLDQQGHLEALRLRQLRNPLPLELSWLEQIPADFNGLSDADGEETVEALLNLLEPQQRSVVRGVVLNGLSYRRMAAELEISPMTVRRLLQNGLKQLRQRISRPGQPHPWPCRAASAARAC